MHEGGCFCGAARFTVKAVFDCVYCHCSECRKLSGAPVFASVIALQEDFSLKGTPLRSYPRKHGAHHFCGECGSELFYARTDGPYVSISLGTFDNPEVLRPLAHQFWPEKLLWLELHDNLPKFDGNTLSHPSTRQ